MSTNSLEDLISDLVSRASLDRVSRSLGNICRYNGRFKDDDLYYSVAEHSCILYDYSKFKHGLDNDYVYEPRESMWGALLTGKSLLHDVGEYVLGDIITPVKEHIKIGDLNMNQVEDQIERDISAVLSPNYGKMMEDQGRWESAELDFKPLDIRIRANEMPRLIDEAYSGHIPLEGVKLRLWDNQTAAIEFRKRVIEIDTIIEELIPLQ